MRAILSVVCGVILGAVIALPVWWVMTIAEYDEMRRLDERRGIPAEQQGLAMGDVVRTSQLFHIIISIAGFGGTIGTTLGATSAILRAVKGDERGSWAPK